VVDLTWLHILQHALGLDGHGRGNSYRNYFVTGAGSTDFPHCTALVEAGLMRRTVGNSITGGDDVFRVTDAGCAYVAEHSPPPPKLTRSARRYQQFLDADSGLSFTEWLGARTRRERADAAAGASAGAAARYDRARP
jgi:hypothetical protein